VAAYRSDKLKNAAGSVTSAAAPLADLGARAQRSAASTWEDWEDAYGSMRKRASRMQDEASRGINETVRNTRTAASDAMSGAAETVNERFDEGVAGARDMFDRVGRALPRKETFMQAQSSLADLLERQTAGARRRRPCDRRDDGGRLGQVQSRGRVGRELK
jgi:hypothetical protein